MSSSIRKAVIPAAGTGSRLSPITDYLPKAMLPLGRKPVLHHIVDELREASIDQIGIVARSNQTAIFKYFRNFPEVEFIIDDSKSGPGGAVLNARNFVDGEDFIVIFADSPIKGNDRGAYLKDIIQLKKSENAVAVISTYKAPESEISSRGVVVFEDQDNIDGPQKIVDIKEKPSSKSVESKWVSACRYVLDPTIFAALEAVSFDDQDELQLTTAIRHKVRNGDSVWGYPLPEQLERYDTGNFDGYFEAFDAFAGRGNQQKKPQ